MPNMNAFDSDVFSMLSLTAALNDVDFVPGRLGEMGLFAESGIRTTTAWFERVGQTVVLVPVSPRGGPPQENVRDLRNALQLSTVRLAMGDTINADEVQNIRAFGSETEMQALQAEVNARNASIARKFDATLEWQRIGAIKGQVLDADGTTVITNLFTAFDVSAQTEVDWDLDNGTPAAGALRTKCSAVIRSIEDELGGLPYSGITTMCSSQFFDDLVAHTEYRDTFVYQEGRALRERTARRQADFGGIHFEEYRGVVGGISFIADDKAHTFPTGVPDLFATYFAPADYWETVNTLGLPRYARQAADPSGFNRHRRLEVQSNPLTVCSRPRTLIPGKRT